jgi:hypothetical protein
MNMIHRTGEMKRSADSLTQHESTPVPLPHQNEKLWAGKRKNLERVAARGLSYRDFERLMTQDGGIMSSKYAHDSSPYIGGLEEALGEFDSGGEAFVNNVLPKMASLAIEIEELFADPLALTILHAGVQKTVKLSRRQGACILCHAFFCTLPGPPSLTVERQELEMQHLTFEEWFRQVSAKSISTGGSNISQFTSIIHLTTLLPYHCCARHCCPSATKLLLLVTVRRVKSRKSNAC